MLRIIQNERQKMAAGLATEPHGLLVPLNRARRAQRTLRLIELVRTLQEIERVESKLREVERQLREDLNYLPDDGPQRAPSHLYYRANEILSKYHWSPRVLPPPDASHSFASSGKTEQSYWESRFVHWVLNLRARSELSRLRCCRNCGHWFYAVTNHQASCSERCRQQFHSKDQRFKETRKLYMRRYRKDEKVRELQAREQVQGKGR